MTSDKKKALIKKLILAKKLLQNSEKLLESDTLEHNMIAVFNLNSALNIILKVLSTQHKIKSIKELKNGSLEKRWALLSEEYKKRYGSELSMKTQIFTLANITQDFIEKNIIPTKIQVQELTQALVVFMREMVLEAFGFEYQDVDFHLLFENSQVQRALKTAGVALENSDYEEVLRQASLAFHVAIEDQRQKLNYLSKNGLLNPEKLMLDKDIELHINSNDQDFLNLVLGTPPKKLEKFKQLVPTVLITEDEKDRAEIVVSDYVDDPAITLENAEFCLNFILETILHWESLDFMKPAAE
jgi:hypothetical protein